MSDPYRRPAPDRPGAPVGSGALSGDDPAGTRPASDAAVVLRGLTVRYARITAIADVDLVAEPGTVLALTGPSGAGKSTLLWAVAGAVRPHVGEVRVGSQRVVDRSSGIRADVALIPQGNGLAGVLTAYENITFPLLATGLPAREAATRALHVLAEVGLADSGNHLVEELSGGQQQRVAVARGLSGRPAVLLADEPTSELDNANRGVVLTLLRGQANRGAVVIMATHDPEAAALADREVRLDEGRMTLLR